MTAPRCPECVQGKCRNCTGWAFDEADERVDCGCAHGEPVELRILTVRQPWAWAIIHGGKDVENRVRNLHEGIPESLHAWTGDVLATKACSAWAQPDAVHLVLANPRPLSEPIPYKGALGLRRLDAETAARVWGGLA